MTITAVGSVVSGGGVSAGSLGFTIVPNAIGDVFSMFILWDQTSNRTVSVSTASSGILWTPAATGRQAYTALPSASVKYGQAFFGVAQSTASLVTTVLWSGTAANVAADYQEFHSSLGSPVWSEVASGINQSVALSDVTSMPGPTLACGTGRLYTGFWFTGTTGQTTGTAKYVFQVDSAVNVYGYRLNTAGTESPSATQSPAGQYDCYGLALTDGAAAASTKVPSFCSGYGSFF